MGRKADTQIRVTEETWQELNSRKRPGESFNDVLERLLDAGRDEGNANATTATPEC
jgi:predicted CopG family antitoxin